jgi:hypothetical protein
MNYTQIQMSSYQNVLVQSEVCTSAHTLRTFREYDITGGDMVKRLKGSMKLQMYPFFDFWEQVHVYPCSFLAGGLSSNKP